MTTHRNTPPHGTIRDWLNKRAAETPDGISHIFPDDGSTLTWLQLRDHAAGIAGGLSANGTQKGESVAICLPNSREAILCLFGILYGGFRATPLNLVAGPEAIGFALAHSRSRSIFVGSGQRDLIDAALAAHPNELNTLPALDDPAWSGPFSNCDTVDITASDEALLMYTSGTTGRPKGVLHSHAGLLAGGWNSCMAHRLGADDRALCVLPFFHINGLCVTLIGPLVSGGTVIVTERFSNRHFWDHCERYRATWLSVVPTIISHLLHSDRTPSPDVVRNIRFARSASAALSPDIQAAFEQRFGIPIVETMGLTETAAQILSNPLPPDTRKTGSPGIAFGNEVTVLDDDFRRLPAGTSGELAVRGPNVMLKYADNEEATAAVFTPDGWLRTGDLGYMDEDGFVFVTGRLKELIIKGGENIAPREVDEALYASSDVIEAAAFARPCDRYGQTVEAAVCLRPGSRMTAGDLRELCVEKLGAFKSPDRIFVLDSLPKGPSGKIQRLQLAALTEGLSAP